MSRKGIEYGSLTLHPDGFRTGRIPGKAEESLHQDAETRRTGGDVGHVPSAARGQGGACWSRIATIIGPGFRAEAAHQGRHPEVACAQVCGFYRACPWRIHRNPISRRTIFNVA